MKKKDLLEFSLDDISEEIKSLGESKFRAKQLWQWLYISLENNFSDMTNFSKSFREVLEEKYEIKYPKIISEQISTDGTIKWLLQFVDKECVETVYIPEKEKGAVCISTQVGCSVGCKFCRTGSQKLKRNLTTGEMVVQFLVAKKCVEKINKKATNVVVMGMGEPLHNTENVIKALNILTNSEGLDISKRRITISTAGVAKDIVRVAQETGVKLAISLHAPNDEIRSQIMPINKQYPIAEVMKACVEYQKIVTTRYITFEYIMLKGINDSLENARELAFLMKKYKLGAKFNLIAFNAWEGCDFEPSPIRYIYAFAAELEKNGYNAPIRKARGKDILAACGQLKSEKEKLTD